MSSQASVWWKKATLAAYTALLAACCISPEQAQSQSQSQPQAESPPPLAYSLEIVSPSSLISLLRLHLDLARFQTQAQDAAITPEELARLISATPAQARALLETEGYFSAQVEAKILPQSQGPPQVRVLIEPGVQATVTSLRLELRGPMQTTGLAGDSDAQGGWQALQLQWALPVGARFSQAAWASAKAKTLIQLRALGYPAATWTQTQALVEAPRQAVNLHLVLDSGPLYLFGTVNVEGLSRYSAQSVLALQPFAKGQRYNDKLILDYQERLRKLGLFETVAVELDTNPVTANAAPVGVKVREHGYQQATAAVGYSDKAGPRVSLEHLHRQVLGYPWLAKNKFEIGHDQQSWEGELLSHPLNNGYRNLIAGHYQTETAAGTTVRSSRLRVGRSLDTENLERLIFVETLVAQTQTAKPQLAPTLNLNTTHQAVSGNVHWLRQTLDNAMLPTEGESANIQLGAGYALGGEAARNGPFARVLGRLTIYRPLGSSWFGSLRVESGQVLTGSEVGIPDTLLFRAGGDESVRGYGFRSLGPIDSAGVRSARVLFTSSAELAHPIAKRWPSLWGASFIDAGQAADHWSELRPVLGYGLGLRWRSPVGPLRVDLAYGEALRKARLHVSLGVNF